MGEYIKASQLDSSHIGKTVRANFDKAQAEDILRGVKHTARLISEGRIFDKPKLTVGAIETTLIFATLGEVDCEPGQRVAVVD